MFAYSTVRYMTGNHSYAAAMQESWCWAYINSVFLLENYAYTIGTALRTGGSHLSYYHACTKSDEEKLLHML